MIEKVILRKITEADNETMAVIIRSSLEEFGAAKPGTVYFDPTTDNLFGLFTAKNSVYFIAESNGEIAGGAGIFPTEGLPFATCELVKMYVSSNARGMGLGQLLLDKCIEEAKASGFNKMYIETMLELINAIEMYKKNGFTFLTGPIGNSGHTGCDIFMIKDL